MAAAGLGSRRKCEEFIREGRVSVDGQIITELGTTADADKQRIELNGRTDSPRRRQARLHRPQQAARLRVHAGRSPRPEVRHRPR